jgi:hypothetical protein
MDSIYLDPSIASREDTNVDEMNIQTMYKMVDECRVKIMGREVSKKVLYLTNQQASLFDEDAMEHEEHKNTPGSEYLPSSYLSSEIDMSDERIVEAQMLV